MLSAGSSPLTAGSSPEEEKPGAAAKLLKQPATRAGGSLRIQGVVTEKNFALLADKRPDKDQYSQQYKKMLEFLHKFYGYPKKDESIHALGTKVKSAGWVSACASLVRSLCFVTPALCLRQYVKSVHKQAGQGLPGQPHPHLVRAEPPQNQAPRLHGHAAGIQRVGGSPEVGGRWQRCVVQQ